MSRRACGLFRIRGVCRRKVESWLICKLGNNSVRKFTGLEQHRGHNTIKFSLLKDPTTCSTKCLVEQKGCMLRENDLEFEKGSNTSSRRRRRRSRGSAEGSERDWGSRETQEARRQRRRSQPTMKEAARAALKMKETSSGGRRAVAKYR